MLVLLATIQLGDRKTRTFMTRTTCEQNQQESNKKPTGNQQETNKKPASNQQETNKKPTESQKAHRETNREARSNKIDVQSNPKFTSE